MNTGKNMKKITIARKKKFAGALVPYWIILGDKEAFMQEHGFTGDLCVMADSGYAVPRITVEELDRIGTRINNGQVLELEVPEEIDTLFVSTMDGCLSNGIPVKDGQQMIITTVGGFRKLPYPVIEY
jgi:hypothetical protein